MRILTEQSITMASLVHKNSMKQFRGINNRMDGIAMGEWRIQCGRVVSMIFALVGVVFSLGAVARCDFFETTLSTNSANDEGGEDTTSTLFYLRVGLFRYDYSSSNEDDASSSSSSSGTGVVGILKSSSECQAYDGDILNGRLRTAQILGTMAPVLAVIGCLTYGLHLLLCRSSLWSCHRQQRSGDSTATTTTSTTRTSTTTCTFWIMIGAWFMAWLSQVFSFVAFQENEIFCRDEDQCQMAGGAISAILAIIFYFMALLGILVTARLRIRAHIRNGNSNNNNNNKNGTTNNDNKKQYKVLILSREVMHDGEQQRGKMPALLEMVEEGEVTMDVTQDSQEQQQQQQEVDPSRSRDFWSQFEEAPENETSDKEKSNSAEISDQEKGESGILFLLKTAADMFGPPTSSTTDLPSLGANTTNHQCEENRINEASSPGTVNMISGETTSHSKNDAGSGDVPAAPDLDPCLSTLSETLGLS